jgi:hypothetical protein
MNIRIQKVTGDFPTKKKGRSSPKLYIIRAGKSSLFKIGISNDPKSRLSKMQVGSADKLRLIKTASASMGHEREAHHARRCVLPPQARECPACGFKIYAATEVVERDGELVELGSRLSGSVSDRHRQECAKKDLWHGALVKIAKQKGYAKAHGWAAHKFREKFGHWPTLNYPPNASPPSKYSTGSGRA